MAANKKVINLINQLTEKQRHCPPLNQNIPCIIKRILEEHQLKQVSGGKSDDAWYIRFERAMPSP